GGHKAAGGFSFPSKHLRQVKSRLANFANQTLQLEHLKPLITVDVRASLDQVNFDLYEQIDQLHPCGIGNPDPIFWTPNVRVAEQRAIGQTKAHLKLTVADDANHRLEAIAWRWGSYCPLPDRLDIAYKLKLNAWQGNTTLQLELVGVRLPLQRSALPSSVSTAMPEEGPQNNLTPKLPASNGAIAQAAIATSGSNTVSEAASVLAETFDQAPEATCLSGVINSADFDFSRRCYQARIVRENEARRLEIQNQEGQVFVVLLPDRQGYLCLPGEPARPVDIRETHYFNLLRAGLDALEIRQQTHLILEKDELLADKDRHIATLNQQIELLKAPLGQASTTEKQQLQALQAEVQAQATAMQTQEARIETLKQQMHRPTPALDPKAIKRTVREAVSDQIWYCLQTQSQRDLYAAYKHVALYGADVTDMPAADYSEAGLRLGFVVEREVIQPCFEDLHAFLLQSGRSELGAVQFGPGRQYPLGLAAPLLAATWTTVRSPVLATLMSPSDDQLYCTAKSSQALSRSDRALLASFFDQWEHPMSQWCQANAEEVATYLDQISKFRDQAAHATAPLYLWAFERMRDRVVGSEQSPGLFQRIYNPQ
ncbi:MAG: single-stranded-DNA-specific exonuclease RecJ, partial [Cyanobacteria bacterium P01_H01_bin.153]